MPSSAGGLVPVRLSRTSRAGSPSVARHEAHELALGPYTVLTTELLELSAASHGLVASYPLWDRRLVELLICANLWLRQQAEGEPAAV